jgi:hypothetical protein
VIEHKRRSDEKEMLVWFCEMCDAQVLSRIVVQGDIATQVSEIYGAFNADQTMRTYH